VSSYFALFGAFLVGVFFVVDIAVARGRATLRTVTLLGVMAATAVLLLLPVFYALLTDRSGLRAAASNPVEDLQRRGADIIGYLVPSIHQPALGDVAETLRAGLSFEQTLFFGYTTMVLAIVAAALFAFRRTLLSAPSERSFMIVLSLVLVPAALLMSLPRVVHPFGISLPAPSWVIGEITTYWRVYSRFAILVGLALVILASVALDVIARRRYGTALCVALLALVAFELAPAPPLETWKANRAPAYATWLAGHPDGIVANYPLIGNRGSFGGYAYAFAFEQVFHGHPLFDLPGGDEYAGTREQALRLLARDLSDPAAPGILAAEGVRYIVVHDDAYRAQGLEPPTPPPESFDQVAGFPGTRVYALRPTVQSADLNQVVADAAYLIPAILGTPSPKAAFGEGFYPPERYADGRLWRWMQQDGTIEVENDTGASLFRFGANAFSANQPRTVTLVDESGRTLATAGVGTADGELYLGPFALPAGHSTLTLHVEPGPEQLGGDDHRVASIFLSPFGLQPVAAFSNGP
jgi:hypothetical protein